MGAVITDDMNYVHVTFTMEPRSGAHDVAPTWPLPSSVKDYFRKSISDDEVAAGEGDYDFAYREVICFAWLNSTNLQKLRDEWGLAYSRAQPAMGFLADLGDGPRLYDDERHDEDGSGWNVGGVTPVLFATISIIGPDARPA